MLAPAVEPELAQVQAVMTAQAVVQVLEQKALLRPELLQESAQQQELTAVREQVRELRVSRQLEL